MSINKSFILVISIVFCFSGVAQLNATQLGYIDLPDTHTTICNDVWGYTDEDGNEYAIVGTEDGISIVDVTNPATAQEIFWLAGMNSIWRDIKVFEDYAYVTTEAEEGLLIIDLTPLPTSTNLNYTYYTGPPGNEWYTAHNLYQSEGYIYIFGAGRGNGGTILLNVATDPMNPIEVGTFDNWYVHDGFVRNDTAYFAHINDGFFSVVDVSNKVNPSLLGTFTTPSNFTHNIWTSEDGDVAYTSDEISGGYLGAYDVSDPANIQYLDKIQSSPGENVMPHNVHVQGDFIYTSYYADGLVVHDATHPHNLVEVANFDTSPLVGPGSVGCWGVYPFLPSGNILATDRQEGLFIIGTSEHQGAYLEGVITEQGTSNPIDNVLVTINGQNISDESNMNGDYATGIEASGTYDVTYFKILYYPQTISTVLTEGVITSQDVELVPIPQYQLTATVLDAQTLAPIENAQVLFEHPYISHEGITDINGEVVLDLYYQDAYDATAGKWGRANDCYKDIQIDDQTGNLTFYLDQGYYDDFSFDFGWTVFGDAVKGHWVREAPVPVVFNGITENPLSDDLWDCGSKAYLTGNGSTSSNTDEVAGGETTLLSPVFDLSTFTNPHINLKTWYFNRFGPTPPEDTLFVRLFNGSETVDLLKVYDDVTAMSLWMSHSLEVPNGFTLTNTSQLIVQISDYDATLNITEAAIDLFSITEGSVLSDANESNDDIVIYPNPVGDKLKCSAVQSGAYRILSIEGKVVQKGDLSTQIDVADLSEGIFLFEIQDKNGIIVKQIKLLKQ